MRSDKSGDINYGYGLLYYKLGDLNLSKRYLDKVKRKIEPLIIFPHTDLAERKAEIQFYLGLIEVSYNRLERANLHFAKAQSLFSKLEYIESLKKIHFLRQEAWGNIYKDGNAELTKMRIYPHLMPWVWYRQLEKARGNLNKHQVGMLDTLQHNMKYVVNDSTSRSIQWSRTTSCSLVVLGESGN